MVNLEELGTNEEIETAKIAARVNFNPRLFACEAVRELAFDYLTAHYLTCSGTLGLTQSKSVGSVSESYTLPTRLVDNLNLHFLSTTPWGMKYLSMVLPCLAGNMIFTPGDTTHD